jgi:hypothetical protein
VGGVAEKGNFKDSLGRRKLEYVGVGELLKVVVGED